MGELSMPPREYWQQGKPGFEDNGDRVMEEFKTAARLDSEEISPIINSITEPLERKARELKKIKDKIDSRAAGLLESLANAREVMLATRGEDKKSAESIVASIESGRMRLVEESTILQEQINEIQNRIHRFKAHKINVEEQI